MPGRRSKSEDSLPWEQQKGESSEAFEAFTVYLQMGSKRSTAKVGRKLGKTKTLMDRWCSQWEWAERVRAYNNDLARQEHAEAVEELKESRKRQRRIGRAMLKKAEEALKQLDASNLDANAIVRLVVEGAKLEKGNLLEQAGFVRYGGDSDLASPEETGNGIDWSAITEEDLHRLASMKGDDDCE